MSPFRSVKGSKIILSLLKMNNTTNKFPIRLLVLPSGSLVQHLMTVTAYDENVLPWVKDIQITCLPITIIFILCSQAKVQIILKCRVISDVQAKLYKNRLI